MTESEVTHGLRKQIESLEELRRNLLMRRPYSQTVVAEKVNAIAVALQLIREGFTDPKSPQAAPQAAAAELPALNEGKAKTREGSGKHQPA